MYEITFTSHKQYLFGRRFSRNERLILAKGHYKFFYSVSKEMTIKPSKVAAFPLVCIL